MRGRVEREAAARFARIATRLEDTGAEPVVTRLARQAAADEVRHAERCDELVARFGGRVVAPAPIALPEIAPPGLTPRERVLFEVVAMSCITESLSTALLGNLREAADDARVREILSEILKDEVQHARLGWAHLAAERPKGPLAFVAEALPRMLDGTVGDELFREGEPDDADVGEALRGMGALGRAERRAALVETPDEGVFAGLEARGVKAWGGRAWLERRVAGS
jgi:hypothetical protein